MDDLNKPRPKKNETSPFKRRGFVSLARRDFTGLHSGMFSNMITRRDTRPNDAQAQKPQPAAEPTAVQKPKSGAKPISTTPGAPSKVAISINGFKFPTLHWPHINVPFAEKLADKYPFLRDLRVKFSMWTVAAIVILAEIITMVQPYFAQHNAYAMGAAGSLLSPVNQVMANDLKLDKKQNQYDFNQNYSPLPKSTFGATGPQIKATASEDPAKGITVTDPKNNIDFTMTPNFGLLSGKKDGNRVVYPLADRGGWAVYSMHAIGVKEDILLTGVPGDKASFSYKLGLGDNLTAHIEKNGNVGVYGNTMLSGNVATGNSKDAALLQKARQNAPKNMLLFQIPAPKVKEQSKAESLVNAAYSLQGNDLKVNVTGLRKGHFPISIDPSIFVTSAQQFMNGNNETNVDFDVADALIEKGPTTGARFNQWTSQTALTTAVSGAGTAAAGGFVYSVGGTAFNGQIYSTAGSDSYIVPVGVTTITVKAWGAGGGGGAGSGGSGSGGAGGGGGFAQADLTVSPGNNLTVLVGTGGTDGQNNNAAGNGGGYTAVKNGGTYLVQAGGGGGGGGARGSASGGAGGAGGGASGVTGSNASNGANGGTQGTNAAGGTGGAAGSNGTAGATGAANAGGDGGGSNTACGTAVATTGGAGGTGAGGAGGASTTCEGGGGGGGGRFGGGGGGSVNQNNRAGGGGGGGSDLVTGANTSQTAGSGTTPGNNSDSFRNGAGLGGNGGTDTTGNTGGATGLVAIYVTGSTSVNTASVSWEQFNPTNGTFQSPNPGTGTCSAWCSSTSYNLPQSLTNFSLVAYNGYLYALGGEDSSCTTGNGTGDGGICKTVYIARLGANGEPALWSPNGGAASFWYRGTDLSSPRSMEGAVAFNNRMYLMGGKTSASGVKSVVTTDEEADITGPGTMTSWTSTGMVALTSARYGFGIQQYNGHLYVIGGASAITSGSPTNAVQYITLNSDGTMAGSWITTNSFSTARMSNGGNFTSVWGAYIYLSGGCTTYNASGYCTAVASDTQLASINADGSLDVWNTNASVTDTRMSYGMIAWQDSIYELGGCTAQDPSTGLCTNILSTTECGADGNGNCTINQDGDASTVATSVASGSSPCSGGSPTNCNIPPQGSGAGQIGQMLNATAIMNGYLYVIGGCINATGDPCQTTSTNTAYVAINTTGGLTSPPNCATDGNTLVGSWCVDSTHTITGGIGAAGTAIFGGRIYVVGGLTGGGNANTILYNANLFNTDGSLNGGWTSESMTGNGVTNAVAYDFAYARANPSSAGTNPGNLYMFGGCTVTSVASCTTEGAAVYKCNIGTSGAVASCSTGSQLQITNATDPNNGNADCGSGLGAMAGTVYAGYVYLIGGLTPNCSDLTTVRYATFDNNNNVVAVSGGVWTQSPVQTVNGRRRGAAFGYNGYIYVVGGYDGVGGNILADIEFAKIDVSNGSIVDQTGGSNLFKVSSVTLDQHRWGLSVPISNSNAYVIGGCTNGASPTCSTGGMDATVTTFQVYNNDSGTPAGYSDSANTYGTNPHRIGAASTILNGYIYVAGGCTGTNDCGSLVNNVSWATIDANGNIGSWTAGAGTQNLTTATAWGELESAGGSLYYIGGQIGAANTTAVSTVYYTSAINGGTGAPTWATATTGLTDNASTAQTRTQFGATAWNNRLYVVGGVDSGGTVKSTVLISPQLNSGGNISTHWDSSSTSFNVARSGLTAVAYANNLYVLGGFDGTNYLSDTQYAQLNGSSSGEVTGSWTYGTSLPTAVSGADGFAVDGYMYLMSGRSASGTCNPATLVAPISANTTIASGNNPTGVGAWYQTNANYAGNRYGSASAYANGKAFILGGACASSTAPAVSGAPTTTNFGASATTHNVSMPGTVAAGDLLLVFFSYDDNAATVTTPGGWTALPNGNANSGSGGVTGTIYAKLAAGTEGGTTVNFVTSASVNSAASQAYRILAANWYGDSSSSFANSVAVAAGSGATTANPNPPALNPANWDTESALWIAYVAGSTYGSVTSSPTNYGAATHNVGGAGATGSSTSTATRALSASSEDPGTYTMNVSQSGVPFTVAVRPPLAYTGTDEVEQTALLTQPQIAQYSIMFDTDTDVNPVKWLLNGIDNSTGAQWQLSYRSESITSRCNASPMTTWGQTTNFGNVTLQTPGVYNALNGSGTNINCARFFYMYISVDSSQAYGYPDDVTRGPTITDLTLEKSDDPAKRLMHGRTFTGGLQQPDDTPF